MTQTTSTRGQLSREEIEHILQVIRLVCQLLGALESNLVRGAKGATPINAKK